MPSSIALRTVLAGSLLLATSGCARTAADPDIPPALNFVLLDARGQNLLTSTSTPLAVSATGSGGQALVLGSECSSGSCTMVRQAAGAAPKYAYYYSTLSAPSISASGVKTWYLNLGGKTDTLYLDVQGVAYTQVRFNGQDARIDPDQPPVYVFRRRH